MRERSKTPNRNDKMATNTVTKKYVNPWHAKSRVKLYLPKVILIEHFTDANHGMEIRMLRIFEPVVVERMSRYCGS